MARARLTEKKERSKRGRARGEKYHIFPKKVQENLQSPIPLLMGNNYAARGYRQGRDFPKGETRGCDPSISREAITIRNDCRKRKTAPITKKEEDSGGRRRTKIGSRFQRKERVVKSGQPKHKKGSKLHLQAGVIRRRDGQQRKGGGK